MSCEIPAMPVLVPLAAIVFALLLWRLRRHGALTVPRVVLAAALVVYGAGVLRSTLLPADILIGSARDDLAPLSVLVNLVPLIDVPADPSGMLLNVLMFAPAGVLLPLVLRRPTAARVIVVALALSLGIELTQLLGDVTISTGRIFELDDLIGNTAGAALGFAAFRLATRVPAIGRMATALAWPNPAAATPAGRPASASASAPASAPTRTDE
ncbi:VanZ family protein [Schumannella soli]|uniref:VanZ family protein n=1 Tax=Schumannella soli TaxID=2590779 RepID=A0A506Y6K2_9MICO|nr:VanZ family protein [Schumannella soli]TPW77662.1 VanZ family protein [Schumannella soli]